MPQTLNLSAALGASKTGQAVGFRLLNLDGTTQAAFTTTNVVEASVAGTYVVTVPVTVADAGARVVWGISGTDYFTSVIDPVPAVNLSADAISQVNAQADLALFDVGLTTAVTSRINTTISSRATPAQVATELLNYDAPTKAELDAAQAAIQSSIPSASSIAAAIMAYAVETGHPLEVVMQRLYAAIRGKSVADDPDVPTTITYYAPDGTTPRIVHTLTDTERTP